METRTQPKVWCKDPITIKYPYKPIKEIGYIQQVSYMRGKKDIPHIEYSLDEEYRNKGIMSKHLPTYLKYCKKYEHNRLIAIVKKDNLPSMKLLEKNGFIKISEVRDMFTYIIDLTFTKKMIDDMIEIRDRQYKEREEKQEEASKIIGSLSESLR